MQEGEGEDKAGRAGAGDEDLGSRHAILGYGSLGHGASFRGTDPWRQNRRAGPAFAGAIFRPPAVPAKPPSG